MGNPGLFGIRGWLRVVARRRLIVFAAAFAGSFIISLRACPAQVPLPIPIASQPALPHGIAVKRVLGNTVPVSYADKRLFDIAAFPATATDTVAPIELRIDIVGENLRRIIPRRKRSSTFLIHVSTRQGFESRREPRTVSRHSTQLTRDALTSHRS